MNAILVIDLDLVLSCAEEPNQALAVLLARTGFWAGQTGVVGRDWDPAGAVLGSVFRWGGDRTREALLTAIDILIAGGAEGRVSGIVLAGQSWDRRQIEAFAERTGVAVWVCPRLTREELLAARRGLEQAAAARARAWRVR